MNPQRKKCPLQKLAYRISVSWNVSQNLQYDYVQRKPESAEKYFSMNITLEEEASTHRNRLACRTSDSWA